MEVLECIPIQRAEWRSFTVQRRDRRESEEHSISFYNKLSGDLKLPTGLALDTEMKEKFHNLISNGPLIYKDGRGRNRRKLGTNVKARKRRDGYMPPN
ncbi:hypothetical protein NPIL_217991 [Nephila pilipes]|uniref:Uncharacterized protein n=1 Tax=Nephila pilipes TaxID=299642 RepID=A0A8X6P4Q4_NEPPI|nr:hypothetical protein NPIL_217991 [Nephila pilipes]